MKKLVYLIISFVFMGEVLGTHIVGGNVTYTYLGGNQYRLTFKVYRDCGSNVQVGFDGDSANLNSQGFTPFYFSVLQANNGVNILPNGQNVLMVGPSGKRKVSSIIVNPCVDTTSSCVEEAVYTTVITVPDPNISYVVMHSRCCRNGGIDNLEDIPNGGGGGSSKPGLTIYTTIPPINSTANTSAVFKNFPPLFLCAGQQFFFDHSAFDANGDQLRYYLVNPLNGGSSQNPVVQNGSLASLTSYATWKMPYNLSNIIGGVVNLSIDSMTGLLAGKPTTAGRYVVSVMVKEFRNAIAIDSAIRDFQFNVNSCETPNLDIPVLPGTFDPVTGIGDFIVDCKGSRNVCFPNPSNNSDSVKWNFGDPNSGAQNVSSATTPCHIFSDTGTFIVKIWGYRQYGNQTCTDTIRRRVRIIAPFYPNFAFATNPVGSPRCAGIPIDFTDISNGSGSNAIYWSWNFGNGNTANTKNASNRYTIGGSYDIKLEVTTNRNCKVDTTIPITIFHKPTVAANIPPGCINQLMTLTGNVTVPNPASILTTRWTLPNGAVVNQNVATYTPTSLAVLTAKLYAITDQGCADSQTFNMVVNPLPNVSAGRDQTICYDKTAQLNATGANLYTWIPQTYLSNATIAGPIASPPYPNSITYSVVGTDANGCQNRDTLVISFYTKPFISAGPDTNVCLNRSSIYYRDSVQLTGQGTFSRVFWTPIAGLNNANIRNPKSKPPTTTDYIFTGIDANQCEVKDTVKVVVLDPSIDLVTQRVVTKCMRDTIQLNPIDLGDITTYNWTPNNRISSQSVRNPFFYNLDTQEYVLMVRNYCYDAYDTITINVPPRPNTKIIREDSTCYGTRYQFDLEPSLNYVWATSDTSFRPFNVSNPTCNPSVSSTYYITITDQYNCKDEDSVKLKVYYPPILNIFGLKRFLCLGDSMFIQARSNISSKISWRPNRFISDTFGIETYVFPIDTQTYICRASTSVTCFTEQSFRINIQKPIIPVVQSPVRICKGKYMDLYASGGLFYKWSPYYHIQDTLSPTPQVYPDTTFRYQVFISNDCFSDTTSVYVHVDTLPKLAVTKDTSIYRGADITLDVQTAAPVIEWSPKDAISSPFSKFITVSPRDTSSYYVMVRDGNFCQNFDTVTVNVFGKNVLLLPTAFTPNGDGINDIFGILKHLNVKKLSYLNVFNRWGEKIFSSENVHFVWDGTYKGEPLPTGTYSWQLEVFTEDGERIRKEGNVQLIR